MRYLWTGPPCLPRKHESGIDPPIKLSASRQANRYFAICNTVLLIAAGIALINNAEIRSTYLT